MFSSSHMPMMQQNQQAHFPSFSMEAQHVAINLQAHVLKITPVIENATNAIPTSPSSAPRSLTHSQSHATDDVEIHDQSLPAHGVIYQPHPSNHSSGIDQNVSILHQQPVLDLVTVLSTPSGQLRRVNMISAYNESTLIRIKRCASVGGGL